MTPRGCLVPCGPGVQAEQGGREQPLGLTAPHGSLQEYGQSHTSLQGSCRLQPPGFPWFHLLQTSQVLR